MATTTPRPPAAFFRTMRGDTHRRASLTRGMRRLICVLVLAAGMSLSLHAQTLTLTITDWNAGSLDITDIASPGSDFPGTITGAAPTLRLSISGFNNTRTVRVSVTKAADETTTWNNDYQIWIRVTNAGTGSGAFTWVLPQNQWAQVTTGRLDLFTVRRARNNVRIELELRNVTVAAGTTAVTPSFLSTLTYRAEWP